MYSENLVVMLLMAATQMHGPQIKPPNGPIAQDARYAMIHAVKEPELVAALSLRAKRPEMRKQNAVSSQTMLASAN
jgi:hypothetical protein